MPNQDVMKDRPVRVSELAEFVYCHRAWWLKMVCKESPSAESREAQAQGELWQQVQGDRIARTDALSGAGYGALLIALLLLVILMFFLLSTLGALTLGVLLLRVSQSRRQAIGMPNGDVFYQDHGAQPMAAATLVSKRLGLRGKPDCLIRTADGIIPIEHKNSARPPASGGVYPNHLIQVLAYIVLVCENYGEPVPYGLVLYGNEEARKVFPTEENLAWLEAVVREVRFARTNASVDRNHQKVNRCRGCGMHDRCDESLA